MFTERTSVGLDVHARSVAAAAIDGVTGELKQASLGPSHEQVRSWVEALPGPVAVVYEAGPTGFGLCRVLTGAGIRCVVFAPSKLQRPAGDRVKTDARDAIHLARLLRLDEVTPVTVPSVAQENARDLVRAREDSRADLMRARHRLSKLLLPTLSRHGPCRRARAPHLGPRGAPRSGPSSPPTGPAPSARTARTRTVPISGVCQSARPKPSGQHKRRPRRRNPIT